MVVANNYFGKADWKDAVADSTVFLNILLSIIYTGLTIWTDYFLEPKAASISRKDFFDNAFGTKFIEGRNSEDYFTNDELGPGIYKMATNLFENIFFTKSITEVMKKRRTWRVLLFFIFLVVLAFWGFKNVFLGLPFLQLFLSVFFLGSLIKLYILHNCCDNYFQSMQRLFSIDNFANQVDKHRGEIIKLYADYEATKAWTVKVDSDIHTEFNDDLSNQWVQIKKKYNII